MKVHLCVVYFSLDPFLDKFNSVKYASDYMFSVYQIQTLSLVSHATFYIWIQLDNFLPSCSPGAQRQLKSS